MNKKTISIGLAIFAILALLSGSYLATGFFALSTYLAWKYL